MEVKGINLQEVSLLDKVLNTYKVRKLILWLGDVGSIIIATLISMNLTNIENLTNVDNLILPISIYIIYNTLSFLKCKCYTSLWRYAGEEEMLSVLTACVLYIIPLYLTLNILGENYNLLFYMVNTILIIAFTGGLRLVYRSGRRLKTRAQSMQGRTKVLVVGGGSAGEIIINELKENPQLNKCPIGIIDDDINKVGRNIHNIKILGQSKDIHKIVEEYEVDEIILAMASVSNERKKRNYRNMQRYKM